MNAAQTKFIAGNWRFSPARRSKTLPRGMKSKRGTVLWHSGLHRLARYGTNLAELNLSWDIYEAPENEDPHAVYLVMSGSKHFDHCPE